MKFQSKEQILIKHSLYDFPHERKLYALAKIEINKFEGASLNNSQHREQKSETVMLCRTHENK